MQYQALTDEQMHHPPPDHGDVNWALQKLKDLAPDALAGDQPFFLAYGAHRPHLPFKFPERFLTFYPEEAISEPDNGFAPSEMPTSAWSNWGELRNYADVTTEAIGNPDLGNINVTLPSQKIKELRRAYYAAVSYADYNIGRLLDKLSDLGLADSTVVVLWGGPRMAAGRTLGVVQTHKL